MSESVSKTKTRLFNSLRTLLQQYLPCENKC